MTVTDAALTLTVAQTAERLQVSETQVRRMVADGTLRTLPGVGRRTLISKAWLARWVETANSSERPEADERSGDPAVGRAAMEERPAGGARSEDRSRTAENPEQPLRASA